jgi:hypothetical protein
MNRNAYCPVQKAKLGRTSLKGAPWGVRLGLMRLLSTVEYELSLTRHCSECYNALGIGNCVLALKDRLRMAIKPS